MKTATLINILEKAGWQEIRQQGFHRIFHHTEHTNLISVPDLGDKPLKMGSLNDIFREAGLPCRVHKIRIAPFRWLAGWISAFKNWRRPAE